MKLQLFLSHRAVGEGLRRLERVFLPAAVLPRKESELAVWGGVSNELVVEAQYARKCPEETVVLL